LTFAASNNDLTLHTVAAWVDGALVTPPPAGATLCWLPSCRALAFAEIRSSQGRALMCLSHYEAARELALAPRLTKAG
jgi:hypothetical protein